MIFLCDSVLLLGLFVSCESEFIQYSVKGVINLNLKGKGDKSISLYSCAFKLLRTISKGALNSLRSSLYWFKPKLYTVSMTDKRSKNKLILLPQMFRRITIACIAVDILQSRRLY